MGDDNGWDTLAHYGRIAAGYDRNWSHSDAFLDWMTQAIITAASITTADRIADVGCGTGLFATRILAAVRPEQPILCVDPSQPMLDQIPKDPGLQRLRAGAEHLAQAGAAPGGSVDVLLMKEAVHHIPAADRAVTVTGLAKHLRPGGRFLVVMLPTTLDYPLFPAALRRFEELQPDPVDIEGYLRAAGLTTSLTYRAFDLGPVS